MNYRQCILRKENKIQTAWIPEIYAKTGKVLTIKDVPGWSVVRASTNSLKYELLNALSRDYTRTRKYSDR